LQGSSIEVAVIEGRPPKTIEVPADDGSRRRYCLAGWVQSGRSADYTYLYLRANHLRAIQELGAFLTRESAAVAALPATAPAVAAAASTNGEHAAS
jgi:hypothetical protein